MKIVVVVVVVMMARPVIEGLSGCRSQVKQVPFGLWCWHYHQ